MPRMEEREAGDAAALDALICSADRPFVIRGLVAEWPLVQAGKRSAKEARDYLVDHARKRPFTVSLGPPGHDGRLFYDSDMEMNFQTARGDLAAIFKGIDDNEGRANPPTIYLTSVDVHDFFDGLHEANHVDLGNRQPITSIWIGTRTVVAAHNDFPDNLACCAVGRRRFTVFPPDQFPNLYLGPIDNTPAGRAVSMVDFHDPDWDAHPRFAEAVKHGLVADLEPGDAVFVPSLWWHHVEGRDGFNAMINYWWRETPRWLGQPQDALNHAILAVRDLPEDEKAIWRQLFDYYVFENGPEVAAHIPEGKRGILDPLTAETAGRIRAFLMRTINQ
ncbi:Pass1-related protein [Altererythrobacter epoxidivorans]|uniref:Pass1-related protein n=1 Tax=Altererythrobacter epoxidivorans TaxID=361183 RepID=A0A0M4MIW1_9SPHN|nr:cupin-like domain-containing protein [Altererythrobacter epoxidivorans]ALE17730.1 Pass1-related protein [Altererythrobacter epoxidivorans]